RHVARFELVFDKDRDAVEPSCWAAAPGKCVEPVGFLDRSRVYGLDRVQRRSSPVVSLDAAQILFDDRVTGHTRPHGVMDVVDVAFDHVKRWRWRRLSAAINAQMRPAKRCQYDDANTIRLHGPNRLWLR